MTVYVLTRGCYSDLWVQGIYARLEQAMAEAPGSSWCYWYYPIEPGEAAHPDADNGRWDNYLDWDDAASIRAYRIVP